MDDQDVFPATSNINNILADTHRLLNETPKVEPEPEPEPQPEPTPVPQVDPTPLEQETEDEDNAPKENDSDPEETETTPQEEEEKREPQQTSAQRKFAQMRRDLKDSALRVKELEAELKEAKENKSEASTEELEKYKSIVDGFAYTQTDEYKQDVTQPWEDSLELITRYCQEAGVGVPTQALEDIIQDPSLSNMKAEDKLDDLFSETDLAENRRARFILSGMRLREAMQKHNSYAQRAQEYTEKFLNSSKSVEKYEVPLDTFTNDNIKELLKEYDLDGDAETINKRARHLAHKRDVEVYKKAVLFERMHELYMEAREEKEKLSRKLDKVKKTQASLHGKPTTSREVAESQVKKDVPSDWSNPDFIRKMALG